MSLALLKSVIVTIRVGDGPGEAESRVPSCRRMLGGFVSVTRYRCGAKSIGRGHNVRLNVIERMSNRTLAYEIDALRFSYANKVAKVSFCASGYLEPRVPDCEAPGVACRSFVGHRSGATHEEPMTITRL